MCDIQELEQQFFFMETPTTLRYLARRLIEEAHLPSFLWAWHKPREIWHEVRQGAKEVLSADKQSSDDVAGFARAVLSAPSDARSRALLAVGASESPYAYWAVRIALTDVEEEFGWLPPADLGVDAEGESGATPLHDALWDGNFGAAQALLDLGADPDHIDHLGYSPLIAAALYCPGDPDDAPQADVLPVLSRLIAATEAIDYVDAVGSTALHAAVRARFTEAVNLLLAAGADPKAGAAGRQAIDHGEVNEGVMQAKMQTMSVETAHLQSPPFDGRISRRIH